MILRYRTENGWEKVETDYVGVFSDEDVGLVGISQLGAKKFVVATRDEPLFKNVMDEVPVEPESDSKDSQRVKV